MTDKTRWIVSALMTGCVWISSAPVGLAEWAATQNDTMIEARDGNRSMLAWQLKPLAQPAGGPKFAGSAFLHPLRTPSGFEWTCIQPADHLHHFGLWWPWKYLEVDGERHNTWEIQQGEGGLVAKSAKTLGKGPSALEWEFLNEVEFRKAGKPIETVIDETVRLQITNHGVDAVALDISINQKARKKPVTIVKYHYSGFSWRGPVAWNKDNSKMLTSEGRERDNANNTAARWVLVSGPTPQGSATVLMMSAASQLAGKPETLRIWDSKNQNGMPFVNFNPVAENSVPLDDAHPAVAKRKYRVIAADRVITASAAEAEWKKWTGE